MDFTLSEEQKMIRETAQALFRKECTLEFIRKTWSDRTHAALLWDKHLSGWVELADGDLTDLVLFMEEHGRALAPGPFFATLLARQVAAAAGRELEGSATLAIAGQNGLWIPHNGDTKYFVPDANDAEHILLVSGHAQSPELSVLARDQVDRVEVENMDHLRPLFTVTPKVTAVKIKMDSVAWQRARLRCLLTAAAELVGVGRQLQDSAVSYAKERQQFGKAIGAFQGLQWKLVNTALDLERAASSVAYAAMCVDAGDADAEKATLIAKAEAGLAARHCARTSLQVHGGIGYTWEQGLHYWLRRAYAGDALMGNHEQQLAQLADHIFS
jgi:alkylation response protein AidB-like acyl-CoA dehydrogenase